MAAAVDLDTTFQALSDPTRRGVIELLRTRPMRAGDLAHRLGMSAPAMSRHLRLLRGSGLVEERRIENDARARVYQLRRQRFSEMQVWLNEIEGFWTDQLSSFKAHVEHPGRGKKA